MLDALEKKLTLRNSEIPSEQLSSKGLKDNADIKSILRSTKGGEQKEVKLKAEKALKLSKTSKKSHFSSELKEIGEHEVNPKKKK